MGTKEKKKAEAWAQAQRQCRLSEREIQMAKQLGMTPRSLIKNIPTSAQMWKLPVKEWIRSLYFEKFGGEDNELPL